MSERGGWGLRMNRNEEQRATLARTIYREPRLFSAAFSLSPSPSSLPSKTGTGLRGVTCEWTIFTLLLPILFSLLPIFFFFLHSELFSAWPTSSRTRDSRLAGHMPDCGALKNSSHPIPFMPNERARNPTRPPLLPLSLCHTFVLTLRAFLEFGAEPLKNAPAQIEPGLHHTNSCDANAREKILSPNAHPNSPPRPSWFVLSGVFIFCRAGKCGHLPSHDDLSFPAWFFFSAHVNTPARVMVDGCRGKFENSRSNFVN